MKDIYDIKDILLGLPININYSLIFILFVIILFVFYKFFNPGVEKSSIKQVNNIEINPGVEKEKKDFGLILKEFEKKYLNLESTIFYSKLIEILREILEEKGNKDISKMTFDQINSLKLDNNLLELIKSIYFKEYMTKIEDSEEIRLELISNVKKII